MPDAFPFKVAARTISSEDAEAAKLLQAYLEHCWKHDSKFQQLIQNALDDVVKQWVNEVLYGVSLVDPS